MAARASNGIMLNPKAVAFCAVACVVVLYILYSWTSAAVSSGTHLKRLNTWKTNAFVDIPSSVIESAKNIKITESEVQLKVDDKTVNVFYRMAEPSVGKEKNPAILFLHGAASSSEVWQQIGTMQLVSSMGHKAIAVDLPGWGKSKGSDLPKDKSGQFLEVLIRVMKLSRPVIVSASMSGMYSLPYIMNPDPSTCQERVGAFVPLAPVYTQKFQHSEYHRCEIPTMIVYGTKDKELGLTSVGNLRNMPNSEIEQMIDAGHPGYQERPDEWHRLLFNFLLAVERIKQ